MICSRFIRNYSTAMKAIRVSQSGGPDVLVHHDNAPIPEPKDDQLLIKLAYAGVNPVDTYLRQGGRGYNPPCLPYTPGKDGAGVVAAVGASVTGYTQGDRVYVYWGEVANGTYAQYTVSSAQGVGHLPKSVSYELGAAVGLSYFTAYRALVAKAAAKSGETVLVHGASGGVGTAAVQIARSLGCTVVATAGTVEGESVVRGCGAHYVYNHRESNYERKLLEEFPSGFDVVVEFAGDRNLVRDVALVGSNGRIVVVGSRAEPIGLDPRLTFRTECSIIGCALARTTDTERRRAAAYIGSGLELGWLRPVVAKVYPLANAKDAHADIMEPSRGATGKLLLKIQELL